MAFRGSIIKVTGNTTVESTQSTVGSVGAYVAYNAAGARAGFFQSVGEAQQGLQGAGMGRPLRWRQQNLPDGTEAWIAEDNA